MPISLSALPKPLPACPILAGVLDENPFAAASNLVTWREQFDPDLRRDGRLRSVYAAQAS